MGRKGCPTIKCHATCLKMQERVDNHNWIVCRVVTKPGFIQVFFRVSWYLPRVGYLNQVLIKIEHFNEKIETTKKRV